MTSSRVHRPIIFFTENYHRVFIVWPVCRLKPANACRRLRAFTCTNVKVFMACTIHADSVCVTKKRVRGAHRNTSRRQDRRRFFNYRVRRSVAPRSSRFETGQTEIRHGARTISFGFHRPRRLGGHAVRRTGHDESPDSFRHYPPRPFRSIK